MNNSMKDNVFSRFLVLYLENHQRESTCGLSLLLGDVLSVPCSNFLILNSKRRSLVRASMKYLYILLRKIEDTGILRLPQKQCWKQNLPANKNQSRLPKYESVQWLGEYIYKLILHINWENINCLVCNMLSKVMILILHLDSFARFLKPLYNQLFNAVKILLLDFTPLCLGQIQRDLWKIILRVTIVFLFHRSLHYLRIIFSIYSRVCGVYNNDA